MKLSSSALPLATAAGVIAVAVPASAQIQVEVNARPVQFGAVQPARVNGRVLIPLRAVVESLGAEVKWEPATQTVRGKKGDREFSLQINSREAMLNGRPVTLDAPAQMISGTTMVPLRFVAEALGAEVEWNAARQLVVINAAADPAPVAGGRIQGELLAVRGDELTLRVGNVRQTYLLRGPEGSPARTVALRDLRAGDQLTLRVQAEQGLVEVVEARYPATDVPGAEALAGEVVEVRDRAGRRTITIQSGDRRETVELPERAPIYRTVGQAPAAQVGLDELRVGDRVKIARNAGGVVTRVDASVEVRPANRGEVTGELVSARRNRIVIRNGNDRASFDVDDRTVILRSRGNERAARATLADLEPGDQVTVQLDEKGLLARRVEARSVEVAQAVPAADLRVRSFTHDAGELLRAGDEIHFTLVGPPKAVATFDAGAVAQDVTLTEDPKQPGRYTGTLVVPRGLTARDVPVIGQVRRDGKTSPLIQAPKPLHVDSEAPVIADVAPKNNEATTNQQPDIYVEVGDGSGSGIDPKSIRLEVGGKDVSSQVKTTPRFLLYSPREPFKPGRVPVSLSLRDKAGNPAQMSWTFTVRQAPMSIQSVTHDGNQPLRPGDTLRVTARGNPKAAASFSIGDLVTGIPLKETAAGVYTGSYRVGAGARSAKAPVVVEFVTADGVRVRQETSAPVTIVAGKVEPPAITAPKGRPRLGDELVVEGTAAPGARVQVEITYQGKAFGALPVKGTFGAREATADKNGRWVTAPFEVRLSLGVKQPDIVIRAVAVDAAGQQSDPTEVKLETR
jgi:hypothetical protein